MVGGWQGNGDGFVGGATLGFDQAGGPDEVFRQLVPARIIEPTSKADSQGVGKVRLCAQSSAVTTASPQPATLPMPWADSLRRDDRRSVGSRYSSISRGAGTA